MRLFGLSLLTGLLCSCGSAGGMKNQSSQAVIEKPVMTQIAYYDRKQPQPGEVLTPPVLLRLTGTLVEQNGCLVLTNAQGKHALAFERGKAEFDSERRILTAGTTSITVGQPISVGGPFNQANDDFNRAAVARSCGVDKVWLVTGTDIMSRP